MIKKKWGGLFGAWWIFRSHPGGRWLLLANVYGCQWLSTLDPISCFLRLNLNISLKHLFTIVESLNMSPFPNSRALWLCQAMAWVMLFTCTWQRFVGPDCNTVVVFFGCFYNKTIKWNWNWVFLYHALKWAWPQFMDVSICWFLLKVLWEWERIQEPK